MLYTHQNTRGASVYDMDAKAKLDTVVSVNTGTGEVRFAVWPLRLNASGEEVDTMTLKFDTIYAIRGLEPHPALFHCYGRKAHEQVSDVKIPHNYG